MVDVSFDDVLERALHLTASEQARLLERLAAEVREALDDRPVESVPYNDDDEPPLTAEEIETLLYAGPKTGAEIAESGVFGGWSHLNISDGAEWVNEQKRKRLERKKW